MDKSNEIAQIYQNARKEKLTEQKAFLCTKPILSEIYSNEGLNALVKTISDAMDICIIKAKDAEAFGKGFFDVIAGGGDTLGEETAALFENLTVKFPGSVKLAEMLADVYGAIVNDTNDKVYAQKLDELSRNNPALTNAALQMIQKLVLSKYEKGMSVEKYEQAIEKARTLYEAHPIEEFASRYAQGLGFLTYNQEEADAVKTITLIEQLLTEWKNTYIASYYLDALCKLTKIQDKKGCAATIAKMESMWNGYPYSMNTLAQNLAYSLANYSLCVEGSEKKKVLDRIAELAQWWGPASSMATSLADGTYF